jgi:glycosyltransferase involved in cell wall biosynthesis
MLPLRRLCIRHGDSMKSTNIPKKKSVPDISIILPVYNEKDNVALQYQEIIKAVDPLKLKFEVLFVDDGSIDGSIDVLRNIALRDRRVKVIHFRRNFGQTAAMSAGIDFSSGKIVILMDADLQNDPHDIPRLLEKIHEGYDVVSGWRVNRKDKLISRKIPSRIANRLISFVSGVVLHDFGCSLKAYRGEVLRSVKLYGEMHRFIPIHASWIGAKITEIPVEHHARRFGKSKYGIIRTFKVILDLFTIKFMGTYATKPIYIFGGAGVSLIFTSFLSGAAVIIMKIYFNMSMVRNPLLLLTIMLIILSVMFILLGILAEIIIRIYHESQDKPPYWIREKINF